MKKLCIAAALSIAFASPGAFADEKFKTRLNGYQEVPVVSTAATGEFVASINKSGDTIDYELTYQGLQGQVRQAHIHVAQRSVNGAIVLWLCQTALNPAPASVAARVPVCPQEGIVTGALTAADVLGAAASPQQIVDGEFDEVLAAIRAGVAYVNVHTTPSPGGEIRGQLGHSQGAPGHTH